MIALENIIPTARRLIALESYFSGMPVIENTGAEDSMIEQALGDANCGAAVLVGPVIAGSNAMSALGVAKLTAEFPVSLLLNSFTNATGKKLNAYTAITKISHALISVYSPLQGENGFTLSPETPFALDQIEAGLVAYTINFNKQTRIV